jgi:hypothetical protein
MSEWRVAIEIKNPAAWIQGLFVLLLAAIAWFRPLGRKRQLNTSLLAAIAIGAILLAELGSRKLSPLAASALQDWLPVPLLLLPYWQVGQFFTAADPLIEKRLTTFDRALFRALGVAPAETRIVGALGTYLEFAYLMVYPLIPLGVATLYIMSLRELVNYYWIVVLLSTYISLAMTPFVRAMPPRALESYEKFRMPPSRLRAVNRFILRRGGIQAITFPSAHVASAIAASLVLLRIVPWAGLIFLLISVSIAVATVLGGYHYAADALLASIVAIVVFTATSLALKPA